MVNKPQQAVGMILNNLSWMGFKLNLTNSNPKTILTFFAAFLLVLNWCSVMRPFPYPPGNITTKGFPIFSGGTEKGQWLEIG